MDAVANKPGLAPFSLKDTPSLIERVFPAQKIGIEAQKERKSNATQTLTALGSYWKGRKPLVLVRACVLACLLPATDDADADLEVFEALMGMDLVRLLRRDPAITATLVWNSDAVSRTEKTAHLEMVGGIKRRRRPAAVAANNEADEPSSVAWRKIPTDELASAAEKAARRAAIASERRDMMVRAFSALPFAEQVSICDRVERLERIRDPEDPLYVDIWPKVNAHLGTCSRTIPELTDELGRARFGRRPRLADPFSGGGSIPFEAARVGCDVSATDLNPVAAMLTWGTFRVVGADRERRKEVEAAEQRVRECVERELEKLGIEQNADGDRAKSFLYCMEVIDPQTGWLVPLSPTWVISRTLRCVARLVPDYLRKCFDIHVEEGVDSGALAAASHGTVQNGQLVYWLAPVEGEEPKEWRV